MNDRRARIIRALGLSYHLLHGVGDSGAVFLGDLRAADGCGNDEFSIILTSFLKQILFAVAFCEVIS